MIRYAITNRTLFSGTEADYQAALVRQTARWAADGIAFIQLREKDLSASELATLARSILQTIHGTPTKLLINSRPDIAIATEAHGVHLTSAIGELTPVQVRSLFDKTGLPAPVVTISCHALTEVEHARTENIDAILFSPVFEKSVLGQTIAPGTGLDRLREACALAAPIPVYALGGITPQNTAQCFEAGAAGIAGIRFFHVSSD